MEAVPADEAGDAAVGWEKRGSRTSTSLTVSQVLRTAERWRQWRELRGWQTAVVSLIVIGVKRCKPGETWAAEVFFVSVSV